MDVLMSIHWDKVYYFMNIYLYMLVLWLICKLKPFFLYGRTYIKKQKIKFKIIFHVLTLNKVNSWLEMYLSSCWSFTMKDANDIMKLIQAVKQVKINTRSKMGVQADGEKDCSLSQMPQQPS